MMNKPVITVTLNPAIDQVIMLERLVSGSMNRTLSSQSMAGGKGINVARALKKFGVETFAIGFIGEAGSDLIEKTLGLEGIPYHFIKTDGSVRTNLKITETGTGLTTELNQPGFSASEAMLAALIEKLCTLLPGASALVLTGSIPAGTPTDAYYQIGVLAETYKIPVFLDADGENLRFGLAGKPYAVKPNRDELNQFSGATLQRLVDWQAAMAQFCTFGPMLVAATMGPEGVLVLDGQDVWHATSPPVTVACATGAGDATLAAMIYGWLSGFSKKEIAAWMCASGSATVAKPGVAFCTRYEVADILAEVIVNKG